MNLKKWIIFVMFSNCLSLRDVKIQDLIKQAKNTREFAYCPYSSFKVGAALLTEGTNIIFNGCNVESSVFSPTVCAERTSVCKAVSEGHQKFSAVAVVAFQEKSFTTPCGVCRQVLAEFGGGKMDVYMSKPEMKEVLCMKLAELLPLAFDL